MENEKVEDKLARSCRYGIIIVYNKKITILNY